jgi:hypothetical protein
MPDERCTRLGSLGWSRVDRHGVSRFPRPQPCSIPCSPARSSSCDRLASSGIGSWDRAPSGVPSLLAHGFRHIGCCSAAVRCPRNVHGRHGLSLECACTSSVGILETDGVACCCPGMNGIQIRFVLAFTGMSAASPLLVAGPARMVALLDTSMRIHVRVFLECLPGIVVSLVLSLRLGRHSRCGSEPDTRVIKILFRLNNVPPPAHDGPYRHVTFPPSGTSTAKRKKLLPVFPLFEAFFLVGIRCGSSTTKHSLLLL